MRVRLLLDGYFESARGAKAGTAPVGYTVEIIRKECAVKRQGIGSG